MIKKILEKYLKKEIIIQLKAIKNNMKIKSFRNYSYSQFGEDRIIIDLISKIKNKSAISYLDIGANHSFSLSNTALSI